MISEEFKSFVNHLDMFHKKLFDLLIIQHVDGSNHSQMKELGFLMGAMGIVLGEKVEKIRIEEEQDG